MYKDKPVEELTIEDLQEMAANVYKGHFGIASKDRRKKAIRNVFGRFGYKPRATDIALVSQKITGDGEWLKNTTFFFKVFESVNGVIPVQPSVPKERSPGEMIKREEKKRKKREAKKIREDRINRRYKDFYEARLALEKCKKMTPNEFYASWEWKRVRYEALSRHGAKCMLCGATADQGVRICVDHIKPRAKYPDLQLDVMNLQILCNDCNMGKGRWDETDWAAENWKRRAQERPEGSPPF